MARISVAIPCYEMFGKGADILEVSFNKLVQQTFRDFEVIITDHSIDDKIESLCDSWKSVINIKYFRNENNRGSPTANTNMGIDKSDGYIIKLLCQDDYLYDHQSLHIISENFNKDTYWMATSYVHTTDRVNYFNKHVPNNTNDIVNNKLGTPSAFTIRNGLDMWFDESLVYFYDSDFYIRMTKKFGDPKIIDRITMINYIWEGQITNTIATSELRNKEIKYLKEKLNNA